MPCEVGKKKCRLDWGAESTPAMWLDLEAANQLQLKTDIRLYPLRLLRMNKYSTAVGELYAFRVRVAALQYIAVDFKNGLVPTRPPNSSFKQGTRHMRKCMLHHIEWLGVASSQGQCAHSVVKLGDVMVGHQFDMALEIRFFWPIHSLPNP